MTRKFLYSNKFIPQSKRFYINLLSTIQIQYATDTFVNCQFHQFIANTFTGYLWAQFWKSWCCPANSDLYDALANFWYEHMPCALKSTLPNSPDTFITKIPSHVSTEQVTPVQLSMEPICKTKMQPICHSVSLPNIFSLFWGTTLYRPVSSTSSSHRIGPKMHHFQSHTNAYSTWIVEMNIVHNSYSAKAANRWLSDHSIQHSNSYFGQFDHHRQRKYIYWMLSPQ